MWFLFHHSTVTSFMQNKAQYLFTLKIRIWDLTSTDTGLSKLLARTMLDTDTWPHTPHSALLLLLLLGLKGEHVPGVQSSLCLCLSLPMELKDSI